MALEKGRQQYFAIAEEDVRLTANTTGFVYLPWNSMTATGNVVKTIQDKSAYANRGTMLDEIEVSQYAEFGVGGLIDADSILVPLYSVFGTATPTTANSCTTWALSVNQLLEAKTFTVQYDTNQEGQKKITGWMAKKLDLDISLDKSEFKLEGAGLVESAGTSLTPAYTDPTRYLLGRHAKLGYATTQVGLTSPTNVTQLRSIKFSMDTGQDIEYGQVLGSLNPVNNGWNGISASLEFTFDSDQAQTSTIRGFADNFDKRAVRIDLDGSNYAVIGTSANKPRLYIDLPPSKWRVTRAIELDNLVQLTVKVEVLHPELITATLINSISAI